jgi:cytochrome b6-f complex iron-sulfur subunit
MSEDVGKTRDRRGFLGSVLMWTGVAAGYGLGAAHFLRYLLPMGTKVRYRELYVGRLDALEPGRSRTVKTPSGETFVMARTPDGVRVLSDVCPHLGCRVHFDRPSNQFLCPCHQGVFDAEGHAVSGPPAEAGQDLTRLDTVIRGTSIFVLVKEA